MTKEKKVKKKILSSTWFLKSKVPYKKKIIKINHTRFHILNTNYYFKYFYNPHNNIKFTKEKKLKKNYLVLYFLKKKKDKSLHNSQSKH